MDGQNDKVGERIITRRRALRITLKDLAHQVGLSTAGLAKIESGETKSPRIETLRAISEKLGMDFITPGDMAEIPLSAPYQYQSDAAQAFVQALESLPAREWDEVFTWATYLATGRLKALGQPSDAALPIVAERKPDYKP